MIRMWMENVSTYWSSFSTRMCNNGHVRRGRIFGLVKLCCSLAMFVIVFVIVRFWGGGKVVE